MHITKIMLDKRLFFLAIGLLVLWPKKAKCNEPLSIVEIHMLVEDMLSKPHLAVPSRMIALILADRRFLWHARC